MARNKITTIIFDFGGVLVHESTHKLEQKYRFDDLPQAKQLRYIKAFHKSEVGKLPTATLLKVMSETAMTDMTPKQIEDKITSTTVQKTWKLLLKLKRAGYKIIIFSNNQKTWPAKITKHDKMNLSGIPFINSSLVGMRKPNLNFYRYMISKYKFDPKKSIFIDDRIKNLPPARKLGIKTFWYQQNYQDLVKFIKKQGIKI